MQVPQRARPRAFLATAAMVAALTLVLPAQAPAQYSKTLADYLLTLSPTPDGVSPAFSKWQSGQYVSFQPTQRVLAATKGGGELIVLCLCDLNDPGDFAVFVRDEGGGATDLMPAAGSTDVMLSVGQAPLQAQLSAEERKVLVAAATAIRTVLGSS